MCDNSSGIKKYGKLVCDRKDCEIECGDQTEMISCKKQELEELFKEIDRGHHGFLEAATKISQ